MKAEYWNKPKEISWLFCEPLFQTSWHSHTCQVSHQPPLLPTLPSNSILLFFLLLAGQIRSFPLHLRSIELTFGKLQENVGGASKSRYGARSYSGWEPCSLPEYKMPTIDRRRYQSSRATWQITKIVRESREDWRVSVKSYQADHRARGERGQFPPELPAFSID